MVDVKKGGKKKVGRKKNTTHSSGMYRKRITLGHDAEGKPIIKAVYGNTKPELEDKIAQLRVERGMGYIPSQEKDKRTWKYWSDSWRAITKPTVQAVTWANYETALKHLSSLNPFEVVKITSMDIETIIAKKFEEGYSKRILALLISTASRIFKLAKKNRAIMFNPAEDVRVPQDAKVTKREAITPEVEEMLWNVKPLPAKGSAEKERGKKLRLIRLFALMQLKCGLRREEVAPLKWANIDLKVGMVTIDKAYNFRENKIKGPKSEAGYRTIPIPDDYLTELKAWKKENAGTLAGRTWVFPYNGGIITEGQYSGLWDILLDAINGITLSQRISDGRIQHMNNPNMPKKKRRHKMFREIEFTSHQLRHTFSTNCVASGIDIRTVQYFMGHASPEMTMGYTHPSQAAISDARDKMNKSITVSKKEDKA